MTAFFHEIERFAGLLAARTLPLFSHLLEAIVEAPHLIEKRPRSPDRALTSSLVETKGEVS
jgi:hypothetical protein